MQGLKALGLPQPLPPLLSLLYLSQAIVGIPEISGNALAIWVI
jgi:hypothetical protein